MICPVCRGTMRWNNERFACPVCGYDDTPKPKPQTKADRIRSMSDKELSKFMHSLKNKCGDCIVAKSNIFCSTFPTCEDAWLAWLKQEAEDGEP